MFAEFVLEHEDFRPTKGTSGAAGFDVKANIPEVITLAPLERRLIPLGFKMQIPVGTMGLIMPRSGLALKYGITVLNAPGLIDSDYRGTVHALLINLSDKSYNIEPKDKVAQLVFIQERYLDISTTSTLSETDRGSGGFGSTGK